MVSRRRRPISTLRNSRYSRRRRGTSRMLALVAQRVPRNNRVPRDPPPIVPGFDYSVKFPFIVRMNWSESNTTTSFGIQLPGNPLASGYINMHARNTIDGTSSSRLYYLTYDEVFTAAYMRATGVDFTSLSASARNTVEFALVGVKAWGPSVASGVLQLRADGGTEVAGYAGQDNGGRNHRAAVGFTYPTVSWRRWLTEWSTSPCMVVNIARINFLQFAPQASGTTFGIATVIDMGELHITVRIRYKHTVMSTTRAAATARDQTVFTVEDAE